MRAVIYARYSSELQRDASIEDQVRICRTRIDAESWQLAGIYTDHASSGASRLRRDYQKLIEAARSHAFDIVVAEALDRLSRDQEDVAALYKQLSFSGVKLITLAEGEINELHVGLKGTMNALFLKDLAQKVRRGLEGRVRQGRSGGGLPYGYRVVRKLGDNGQLIRGEREIDMQQAKIIVRIFELFIAGKSPRAIARELNADRTLGPFGRPWVDTTIRGHAARGCGVLRNEIYIGRLIWNKQRFLKDPDTGRRVTRINSDTERVVTDVPDWRIVPQEIWDKAQIRLQDLGARPAAIKARERKFWERRRPRHLLTGLVQCASCGSNYAPSGRHYLSCSAARRTGTCDNRKGIPRTVLEDLILNALKQNLMRPDLVREFVQAYHAEINRQRLCQGVLVGGDRRELAELDRKLTGLIDAIAEGFRAPGLQDRLDQLSQQKVELQAQVQAHLNPLPRLHPRLAELYRRKVGQLREALECPATHDEALEILRQLIEKVVVRTTEGGFEIDLSGEIASMLALPADTSATNSKEFRRSVKVVAGEGVEPPTLGL